jgi:hypothetical protein
MRASIHEVIRTFGPDVRDARLENKKPSIWELQVMLKRIFLIGAVLGIALAHGVVLYKIDVGARSNDVQTVMASRSHRALW